MILCVGEILVDIIDELIEIVKKANICGAYATMKKGALLDNLEESELIKISHTN